MTNYTERMAAAQAKTHLNKGIGLVFEIESALERMSQRDDEGVKAWAVGQLTNMKIAATELKQVNEWLYALSCDD